MVQVVRVPQAAEPSWATPTIRPSANAVAARAGLRVIALLVRTVRVERAVEAVTPAAHPLPRGSEHHAAMTIAYVALGANLVTPLGDAHSTLTRALDDLAQLPNTRVTACSSFYRSAPVDADGPDFINAVAALDTTLDAPALLAA